MKKRIFAGMCTTAILAVVLSAILLSVVCYQRLYSQMMTATKNEAGYVLAAVEGAGIDYLDNLVPVTNARITWIAADGTVLYDSAGPEAEMENHGDRLEVRSALQYGSGQDERLSSTLGEKTYYYALRMDDGTVVRVSNTIGSVYTILLGAVPMTVVVVALAVVLAVFLSRRQTEHILKPLNSMDLEEPASHPEAYDELAPFFVRIAGQNKKIREQMEVPQRQQRELASITANMREGLVVLDGSAAILAINRSARAILGAVEENCTGQSVFAYCRDRQFLAAVEKALSGESADGVVELRGRTYRLITSPPEQVEARGAILLLVDVTESYSAEQLRREFSANVSHELKTPLTSISGYAELLQSGMVKQEDVVPFARRIYSEANRLIALVQDIIKLSRLDEGGGEDKMEPVKLLTLAGTVADRLQELAEERRVIVWVEGEERIVQGVPALLDEMVYNLCENAVRYNRTGGSVTITVGAREGKTFLSVADTGIGIPEGDRERVFERFYRVDSGRSKQSGGTGLGLSIVKHAARCHGARIDLSSREGEGTVITVSFP